MSLMLGERHSPEAQRAVDSGGRERQDTEERCAQRSPGEYGQSLLRIRNRRGRVGFAERCYQQSSMRNGRPRYLHCMPRPHKSDRPASQ
jgi:hypothetical protein